jgi:ABC-type uncharacterized transport system ATPase subunit
MASSSDDSSGGQGSQDRPSSGRTRGYGLGAVDTVISVDDVARQAEELAESGPDRATLAALSGDRPTVAIEGLRAGYGKMEILHGLDLFVGAGQSLCLIGPNGAGKSSFFRLILGEYQPDAGRIVFKGEDLNPLRSFARIRRGISVKFQVPGIFKALSIRQNLEIAFQSHIGRGELDATIARILDFVGLSQVSEDLAGSLSHGQQQWLEIGMAVGVEPSLLLLDEPTAGMSPDETYKTGEMLRQLNAQGITILAVEHDMAFVKQIADRVTVLHFGAIFAQGSVADVVANPDVAEIYLGHANGG